ncbi:MAG: HEPN domain-containing protein [Chloroflexota bacterium]
MPPDPFLVPETRAWLAKSAEDLRAADHGFTAVPPLVADITFHCQQCVEKAMKGLLTWHGKPFRKTHSLEEIGELCAAIDPNLEPLVDRVAPLTAYVWKYRYPGEPDTPDLDEAQAALALAREVNSAILARLPEAVQP